MKRILIVLALSGVAFIAGCKEDGFDNKNNTTDGWTISAIGDASAENGEINTVCDGSDKLHVCYSSCNGSIKYATNKTGSWVKTTLASEAGNLLTVSDHGIAIDRSNKVHIIYATETIETQKKTNIYYTTDKSGTLETELIYTADGSCSKMDIAATADGHVHIVFGDENHHLMYKNNLSGSWTISQIDSYWVSVDPSLALDANENLYVAYNHAGEQTLKLQLIDAAGNLVCNSALDDSGDIGSPSICIDKANGAVNIIYWEYLTGETKLYNNGIINLVETKSWSAGGIVLDRDGNRHMTYVVGNVLKLATRSTEGLTIDILPGRVSSSLSDVVVDSTGNIYVVYQSGSTHDLCVISNKYIS